MNTKTHLTIIAYGNPSRGDDGAAPLLLKALSAMNLDQNTRYNFNLIEDLQLNPEHVFDLVGTDTVIFVDACRATLNNFSFSRISAEASSHFSTHVQSPENILALFELTQQRNAPPSYLLAIEGKEFELNTEISDSTLQAIETALAFLQKIFSTEPQSWLNLVTSNHELAKPGKKVTHA
ncbi:hypothetical protein NBRC116493_19360 [Aurantivibrio infirmus]